MYVVFKASGRVDMRKDLVVVAKGDTLLKDPVLPKAPRHMWKLLSDGTIGVKSAQDLAELTTAPNTVSDISYRRLCVTSFVIVCVGYLVYRLLLT